MQQKILLTSGMDSDTAAEYFGEGKARKRINCRVLSSDNDEGGSIETMLGNTITEYELPDGLNIVIGSEEDKLRKKIYYFVFNENQNHSILEYDEANNIVTCVFQNSILNFQGSSLITGIDFIELDENNHLLYWTDNYNEPCKINIEKGILFMQGDYVNGYANPFNPENIFRIKQPMLLSPTAVYADDSVVLGNRLINKLFQFKVQFVYDDFETTAWSPISKTAYPTSTLTNGVNNRIDVTVDTGIEIVKRIRIAAKEANEVNYKLIVDLDKDDLQIDSNATYTFQFYNNGNYTTLGLRDSSKLFDNVPKLSQAQEIIKPGKITDGNITEGFDPVDIDLKLDYTLSATAFGPSIDGSTITNGGGGYQYAPTITISGDGTGATARVSEITADAITILFGGSGYTNGVWPLTFTGGGGASMTGTATVAGNIVTSTNLTSPGSGYTSPPTITLTGAGGSGALFATSFEVTDVEITNGGSNYTVATASFSDGIGSDLAGTAVLTANVVTSITLTDSGTSYTQSPSVVISGGGGAGATAVVEMKVESVVITSGGTGFTNGTYALTFTNGDGTLAAGTYTTFGGSVVSANITVQGSGYYDAPDVSFTLGGGSGATGYVLMEGLQFVVTNGGAAYATPPTVTITQPTTAVATLSLSGLANPVAVNALKRGGQYTYGVIYYDHGNRSGVTNINDGRFDVIQEDGKYGTQLFIPFYTQIDPITSLPYGGYVPTVTYELYNEAPSWATHYQFARVKNVANDRYIQFIADHIAYLNNAGATISYGDPNVTRASIVINNIAGTTNSFKTTNPGSILVYDFVKGDRIRFIRDSSNNLLSEYFDFEIDTANIEATYGLQVLITFPPGVLATFPNLLAGSQFEIYSPGLQTSVDSQLTYEFGEGGTITHQTYSGKSVHNTTTPGVFSPNQIIFNFTDIDSFVDPSYVFNLGFTVGIAALEKVKITTSEYSFYGTITAVSATQATVTRDTAVVFISPVISIDDSLPGTLSRAASGTFSGGDTFYRVRRMLFNVGNNAISRTIEDANFSDLYLSPGYDYGRPNRIDKLFKEIHRPSTIYYSENFIPETFINGLSSVYDDNFETYDSTYGGIQKLYSEDQSLICFQELKISNIKVNQIIYNDLNGGTNVGGSESVLSPQAIYYAGEYGIGRNPESFAVYGHSKYSVDAKRGVVTRLSIDGLTAISDTGFMHNYFTDKLKEWGSESKFYGTYDVKAGEYIVSMGNETLAWNEKYNAWSTFYSFVPENMCTLNTGIVSFKEGQIYIHNTNELHGNFYGVQYQPEFWVYCNASPSNVKILTAISEETNAAWEVYSITTPNGQSSNLIVADFEEKENNQYASVLKDANTPNVLNPLFEGDVMRDRTFLVKFRYTGTDYNKINAVNFYFIASELSNRN